MKLYLVALALVLAAVPATAQRHKLTINAETPEGQLLQQIGQEQDPTKKLALLDKFASTYPKHESIIWVYEQMQPLLLKAGQYDRALDIGDKVIALDPEDVESAHAALKAAEAKKDPDQVKKWAAITSAAARKVAQSPKPEDADEQAVWTRRVDFARQVDTYTEYSLYAMALATTDPRKRIELIEALRAQNPNSKYLAQVRDVEFLAYRQAGDNAKALALAEKTLETDQSNEDMLLIVADSYMQQKKDKDKLLAYCAKIVELMNTKPKPPGESDANWEKKKTVTLGLAHYMMGVTYANDNKYATSSAKPEPAKSTSSTRSSSTRNVRPSRARSKPRR
jgi:tetratricopeptide (TPR) repeat protein